MSHTYKRRSLKALREERAAEKRADERVNYRPAKTIDILRHLAATLRPVPLTMTRRGK